MTKKYQCRACAYKTEKPWFICAKCSTYNDWQEVADAEAGEKK